MMSSGAPRSRIALVAAALLPLLTPDARADRQSGEFLLDRLGTRGFTIDGVPRSAGPTGVDPVGDVDGDGIADAILRLGDGTGWQDLVLLPGGNHLRGRIAASDIRVEGVLFAAAAMRHFSGSRAVAAGDLDGDGLGDFFVSAANGAWPGVEGSGRVYLILGQREFAPRYLVDEEIGGPSLPGVIFYSSLSGTRLGGDDNPPHDVALLGDLDGDGRREIAFGAPFSDAGERRKAGRVFVFSWSPELAAQGAIDVERFGRDLPGYIVTGAEGAPPERPLGDMAGGAVAGPGDVNGDGLADLLIGATRSDSPHLVEGGLVYLIYGSPSPPAHIDLAELGPRGVRMRGAPRGLNGANGLGGAIAGVGDIDGDGLADFVLGAHGDCCSIFRQTTPGRVYLVLGRRDFPEQLDLEAAAAAGEGVTVLLEAPGERAGYAVSSAGDLDLDGVPDFVVGAPWARRGGMESSGAAYLLYGGPRLSGRLALADVGRNLPGLSMPGEFTGDTLGDEVAFIGDVSGDGLPEVALVASRNSIVGRQTSLPARIYVLYGGLQETLEVTRIEPPEGSLFGGYEVTLRGSGLGGDADVRFAGMPAEVRYAPSTSELRVRVPGGSAFGTVDVEVRRGGATILLEEGFEYVRDLPAYTLQVGSPGVLVVRSGSSVRLLGHALAMGDLDGDGHAELAVAFLDGGGTEPKVAVVAGGPEGGGEVRLEDLGSARRGWVLAIDDEGVPPQEVTLCIPGDLDGDGLADLVVGVKPGTCYAIFGRARDPSALSLAQLLSAGEATRIVWRGPGAGGFRTGPRVAAVGDLDGDGLAEVLIGLPQDGRFGSFHVVAGRRQWPGTLDLSGGGDGVWTVRGGILGALGDDVAGAGDIDLDGVPDIIATSYHDFQDVVVGRAWLVYGIDALDGVETVEDLRAEERAVEIILEEGFRNFKESRVAGGFDLDGDGFGDVAIGVQGAGEGFEGAVFVLHGGQGLQGTVLVPSAPGGERVTVLRGEEAYAQTMAVAGAGDFDGDGLSDLIVGAPGSRTPQGTPGTAYLVLGGSGGAPELSLGRLGSRGFAVGGVNVFGGAGYKLAGGGDFDGNGRPDIAIAEREGLVAPGNVYVLLSPFGGPRFRRGDATGDERVDISDGIRILGHLFLGEAPPECIAAADVNDSGTLEISDAIALFGYLFLGFPPPPPPGPRDCGVDLTHDALTCERSPCASR